MLDPETLADVRRGLVPAYIYNDRKIFELEKSAYFNARGFSSGTNQRSLNPAITWSGTSSRTHLSLTATKRGKSERTSICACIVVCRCAGPK